MSVFIYELRRAARALARTPGFSAAVVLCLSLGLGAAAATFAVVYGVLLRPLPYQAPERLTVIWNRFLEGEVTYRALSDAELLDLDRSSGSLEALAGLMDWRFVWTGGEEPRQVPGALVTSDFFTTLGIEAALGRGFSTVEGEPGGGQVVLLSHGLWQRGFGGDPGAVGRVLTLNGKPHTVVGVLPEDFRWRETGYELFAPLVIDHERMLPRDARAVEAVGRLRPGASLERLRIELGAVERSWRERHPRLYPEGWGLEPASLAEDTVSEVRPAVLALQGVAVLVLLLAAGNAVQLLAVRAARRDGELALRAAVGASRRDLLRSFFTETLWLTLAGGLFALLLAHWGLRALLRLAPAGIPRLAEVGIGMAVAGFVFGLGVVSAFALAALLAGRAARLRLGEVLKLGARRTTGGRGRRLLVTSQVAMALAVLFAAGLLLKSLERLWLTDPGFDPEGLLTVELYLPRIAYSSGRTAEFFASLVERASALPGARRAAAVSELPMSGADFTGSIRIEDRPRPAGEKGPAVGWRTVTGDYFATLGIPILAGRGFDRRDHVEAPGTVVVDEGLARRLWPDRSPLGQRLALGDWADGDWLTVVGVAGQVRHLRLDAAPDEQLYLPHAQNPRRVMSLVVRCRGDPMALAGAVRSLVRDLDPELPVQNLQPMSELVSRSAGRLAWNAGLASALATTALALAMLGVYSLAAYSVAERRREIGLRRALGSRRRDIVWLVLSESLRLAAAGIAGGLLAALWAARGLESLLYGVSPGDPAVVLAAAGAMLLVVLAATLQPALAAARVDPAVALRSE